MTSLFLENYISDILPEEFLKKYINKETNFGFGGLGYIVYKRTYARLLPDGNTEEWWQTIARCINGAQSIGAKYSPEEAQRLFDYMFNLKGLYSGRMLWQLGTSTVERFGANSLLACWAVAMKDSNDFCFLFENLMLGGGVGFSVKREDVHELPKIKKNVTVTHKLTKDADFIVPDSREGWVKLLKNTLDAYFYTGESFTYSTILVRGSGEPIGGFGGTASGPGILVKGLENITNIIKQREGKKLRSIDVLDICNIIGSIVVSGNVRRSAQIAIGDPDDFHFLRAKRWELGNIPNWRAMSNNTTGADSFEQIPNSVWDSFEESGETVGLFNLPLSQKFGRLGEVKTDNCILLNPCITKDAKIKTDCGDMTMQDIMSSINNINVLTMNTDTNELSYERIVNRGVTRLNTNVIKINLKDGSHVKLTPDHMVYVSEKGWIPASELVSGDKITKVRKQ